MIWVAAGAIAALALVAVAALHTVGQLLRAHARERNLLVNQVMHLAGRTWEPPPTPEPTDVEEFAPRFEYTPTAMPDFYEDGDR